MGESMPSDPPNRSEADSNPFRSPSFSFDPSEANLRPAKKSGRAGKRVREAFADEAERSRALSFLAPATPAGGQADSNSKAEPRPEPKRAVADSRAQPPGRAERRSKIPVARPVERVLIPRLETEPEEEVAGPILTRREAIAWGISFAIYTLLLIFLATRFLTIRNRDEIVLTTSLPPGGSLFGDDAGLTDSMGGVEVPPALPETEALEKSPIAEPPALTATAEPPPDAKAILQPTVTGSLGGDGLSGQGRGGGAGGEGFGLARFGAGAGEQVQGVQVKVGDPQFTLIWNSAADLDLHVVEPGSSEIYWEKPRGDRGGELDVDDIDGFGPENVYWGEERGEDGRIKAKGTGPAGSYRWFVVYYGGFGGRAVPTRWKVRVKHNGTVNVYHGVLNSFGRRSKTYTLNFRPEGGSTVGEDEAKSASEGGSGK